MPTNANSINFFSPAKWVVSTVAGEGTHTTIGSAITSSSSGDTIIIMPGTYTENLTLKAGVNLSGYGSDSGLNPLSNTVANVIILGNCTLSTAGTVTISGVQLKTNGNFCVSVTGSVASILNLVSCYINCVDHQAITYSSSSASSELNISYCQGQISPSAFSFFTATSLGTLSIKYCDFENGLTGENSSALSTTNATTLYISHCVLKFPITMTAATSYVEFTNMNTSGSNATCLQPITSGTCTCHLCEFSSGTIDCLHPSAGTTVNAYNCTLNSSGTNALAGNGTVVYGGLTFVSATGNTVTTKTPIAFPVVEGGTGSTSLNINGVLISGTTTTSAVTALTLTNGQIVIGNTSGAPAAATLSAGNGINIGTGANSTTISATGGGFLWTNISTATQALFKQNAYVATRGAGVTFTLPSSSITLGDTYRMIGNNSIVTINQNASQMIYMGNSVTTTGVGGSIVGTIAFGNSIEIVALSSTVFLVVNATGAWTLT